MTFDDATIYERRSDMRVEYKVRGTLDAVLKVIKSLFERYHPLGYGTVVKDISLADGGEWTACIKRASSCD